MEWIQNKKIYTSNVCDCIICNKIIKDDVPQGFHEFGKTNISEKNGKAYPTADAMDKSRRHYLNTKIREYNFCRSAASNDIISYLVKNYNIAAHIKSHSFSHLDKWINVLQY